MNLSPLRLSVLATVAGLLLTVSSTPALAAKPGSGGTTPPPVTYAVTYLDPSLTFWRLNESGAAAGWTTSGELLAKVRLADGTVIDLNDVALDKDPDYEWSLLDFAAEINESGQIAGRGWRIEDGVPQSRLFRYSPNAVDPDTNLPLPRLEAIRTYVVGPRLFLKGMNDNGDVLLHASVNGQSTLPANPRAGNDSAWIFSGPPGSGTASLRLDAAVPGRINNSLQVTGAVDMGLGSFAFLSTPGSTTPLLFGTINGNTTSRYDVSEGMALNDAGLIAGWAVAGKTKGNENTSQRAVRLRSDGTWADLTGTASGANSWASAMNNGGVAVGTAGGVNGLGFITISGKLYSLRDLITNPPANLKYVHAKDISNAGVICGSVTIQNADGTTSESGVILTPSVVPVP